METDGVIIDLTFGTFGKDFLGRTDINIIGNNYMDLHKK